MKKFIILLVSVLIQAIPALSAVGDMFTVDGINYKIVSPEDGLQDVVAVTGFESEISKVTIPAKVENVNDPSDSKEYIIVKMGDDRSSLTNSSKLEEITFAKNSNIKEIANYAFRGCSLLRSIDLPNTVTSIRNSAFDECRGLVSIKLSNSLESISNSAFRLNTSLEIISIPNRVTSIGKNAFQGCNNLKEVHLTNGLETIGEQAFLYCHSLQSMTIPESVKKIDQEAFSDCSSLNSVTFLNVTPPTLGSKVFYNRKNPNEESSEDDMLFINVRDISMFESAWTSSQIGRTDYEFVEISLLSISDVEVEAGMSVEIPLKLYNKTDCYGLQVQIELPVGLTLESIEKSGRLADNNNFSLTYNKTNGNLVLVSLKDGLPAGDGEILSLSVKALKDFTVGNVSVKNILMSNGTEDIALPDATCTVTAKATTVVVKGITYEIDEDNKIAKVISADLDLIVADIASVVTFEGVDYPVTAIGNYALRDCMQLTTFICNATDPIPTIGLYAFPNNGRVRIYVPAEAFEKFLESEVWQHARIFPFGIIEEGNIKVSPLVFSKIDENVEDSDVQVIGYSENLGSVVNIPTTIFVYESDNIKEYNVTRIGNDAFKECKVLITSVSIPSSVTSIGMNAFDSCKSLTEITIPETVTIIDMMAFQESGLKKIVINANIQIINGSTFNSCNDLSYVEINSDKLVSIGNSAFYGCSRLKDIILPESVTTLIGDAFGNAGLESIVIPNAECVANSNNCFSGCENLKITLGNMEYKVITQPEDRLTLGTAELIAYKGDYDTTELVIPSEILNLYSISGAIDGLFKNFSNLKNITVGDLTYLVTEQPKDDKPGKVAVKGPTENCEVAKIVIPENILDGMFDVTSIGDSAFENYDYLKSITIPETLETIGQSAFKGCFELQEIYSYSSMVVEEGNTASNAFDEISNKDKITVYVPKESIIPYKENSVWKDFYYDVIEPDEPITVELNGITYEIDSENGTATVISADPDLTSVVIPASIKDEDGNDHYVTAIADKAFNDCENLTSVTITDNVKTIGSDVFADDKVIIYVPDELVEEYKEKWTDYANNIMPIPAPTIEVSDISLDIANASMEVGETLKLKVSLSPDNATDKTVIWSSSDESVAKVENGVVTALKIGRATISASSSNKKSATCTVTIDKFTDEGITYLINGEGTVDVIACDKSKESVKIASPFTYKQTQYTVAAISNDAFEGCDNLYTIVITGDNVPKIEGDPFPKSATIYVASPDKFEEENKDVENNVKGFVTIDDKPKEMPTFSDDNKTIDLSATVVLPEAVDWNSNRPNVASVVDGKVSVKYVGKATITVSCDGFSDDYVLTVNPKAGDANWDGKVEVADAVNIANYVLKNYSTLKNWMAEGKWGEIGKDWTREEWNGFYDISSDINGDAGITVGDAVAAINLVLNQETNPTTTPRRISANDASSDADYLAVGNIFSDGSKGLVIPVMLSNSIDYVAIQVDICMPEGLTLDDVIAGGRAVKHKFSSRRIDDRTMRVVLFDISNPVFVDNDGSLLQLIVNGDKTLADQIEILNVVASDINSKSYYLNSRCGVEDPNSIGSVAEEKISIVTNGNGVIVENAIGKKIMVYTMDGSIVKSFVADSDAETVSLSQGIYIIAIENKAIKISVK